MPIHDWTRVQDCLFHSFQLGWVSELCQQLNHGVLPASHFAMSETLELRPPTGFCVLPEPDLPDRPITVGKASDRHWSEDQSLPQTRFIAKRNEIEYAHRAITIRESDTHAVVAAILIISRQDKLIKYRWEELIRHVIGALSHGIHLLVIDLFPPAHWNPRGTHELIWDRICEQPFELPPDKPLTLAAYAAGSEIVAYVEPVAVGDILPDRPIFLTADHFVNCPLEATYQATWNVFPAVLKAPLERPSAEPESE